MMGRLAFLVGQGLTIAIALFCALAPLGPPSSLDTGSAFNPATTGVVLKARSPAHPQASEQAVRATHPDPLVFLLVLPLMAGLAMLWRRHAASRPLHARPWPLPTPMALNSRRKARAPPSLA
ncbi:MAG: hypothetical protein PSY12_03375 [bacterium]|nr:hypothetical protein [bacterium]